MDIERKEMIDLNRTAISHIARMDSLKLLEPHVEISLRRGCSVNITVYQKNFLPITFTFYHFYSADGNKKYLNQVLAAIKTDNMLKVKALREKRDS